MHIRKFDHDYSRRAFLAKTGMMVGAGLLTPLWPLIAKSGDITKAYPDELLSIDAYTKGKIKTGDLITADNVEIVKDLLTPIIYIQVKEMGRRIRIVPTTRDVTKLFPWDYLEATLKNNGKAKFDQDGNVWTNDGRPWIGGSPFPDAKSALEVFANMTLSWSRHDSSVFAIKDTDLGPHGNVEYAYNWLWFEDAVTGRLTGPGSYGGPGHEGKLRYNTVYFAKPDDVRGTAFLNTWSYDQRKFPELIGYVPAFKRVRKFPTNQRFEPLVAGLTFYLSDAWAAGDPMLTWGNYKLIERKPLLAAVNQNWHGDLNDWAPPVHGGPQGLTFYEYNMELVPEAIVCEAEPVGYPRAPVGKKRVWVDARSMQYIGYETYDRRGQPLKSFDVAWSMYEKGDLRDMTGNHPTWSWTQLLSHDIQANRMTRFYQAPSIGGIKSARNVEGLYEKYLTEQAIQRLGA